VCRRPRKAEEKVYPSILCRAPNGMGEEAWPVRGEEKKLLKSEVGFNAEESYSPLVRGV